MEYFGTQKKRHECLIGSTDLHRNNRTSEWNYSQFFLAKQKSSQYGKEIDANSKKNSLFKQEDGIIQFIENVNKKIKIDFLTLLKYSKL